MSFIVWTEYGWRLNGISEIRRHWLRRLLLVTTAPLCVAWSLLVSLPLHALCCVAGLIWGQYRYFRLLWRSLRGRWDAPREPDEAPRDWANE